MEPIELKDLARARYGAIADRAAATLDCAPTSTAGCRTAEAKSRQMGYSEAELAAVPEGANLGLGCGNPQAIAALRPGEVVVDLGSGAGFDCFLAARQVGPEGRVIGVDMTHEMLAKARANAAKIGVANVEFRLGEIEHLPIADAAADVVISNCVVNLVPDKAQVYGEAFRVLKPGGRVAISDVVAIAPLPEDMRADPALLFGCVNAIPTQRLEAVLREAGFAEISIEVKPGSRDMLAAWVPGRDIQDYVAAALIRARKPKRTGAVRLVDARIDGGDAGLRAALGAAGLPTDDLEEPGRSFFAYRTPDGTLLGYGGYERLGALVLVRSIVVLPEARGRDAGRALLALLLRRAAGEGARDAWLLTTTAPGFFRKLGFQVVPREAAPEAVLATREAASLCPVTAVLLTRPIDLPDRPAPEIPTQERPLP